MDICHCTAEHVSSAYGGESVNTFSPSFRLDVDRLLQDIVECDRDNEVSQVRRTLLTLSDVSQYYTCTEFHGNSFVHNLRYLTNVPKFSENPIFQIQDLDCVIKVTQLLHWFMVKMKVIKSCNFST